MKGQIILRDDKGGEVDLFYFLETLEKRISALEAQVRGLMEDEEE